MNNTPLQCRSEYVPMRDGVRLAVSVWLPANAHSRVDRRPAILTTTRYWRAKAFRDDSEARQFYYPHADYFWGRGYRFVVVDARGTGASFGTREGEITPDEVEDIDELIQWVAEQSWCDGRVATNGTSYTANTALHSLASVQGVGKTQGLKAVVCRAADFDLYRHLMAPGGIVNHWFIDNWGKQTAAQDQHDVPALIAEAQQKGDEDADSLLGVKPVDNDPQGILLASAIAEHQHNVNVADRCADANSLLSFGSKPYHYQAQIDANKIPLVIRCGWHDAATALGALSLFCTFNNPVRVILGPWSHNGSYRIDPFKPGDGRENEAIAQEKEFDSIADSLAKVFDQDNKPLSDPDVGHYCGLVEYYTLGENRWKTTSIWPLPQTNQQRFYLSENHQLTEKRPSLEAGCDHYKVDPSTSTGINNRWGCQMKLPVFFDDRSEGDKKRLVYDTKPLERDTEITGHPVVTLFIRSSATDGQFFVYLESIDPDGRVRWLTDGQLRALHRKVSDEAPPFTMFGPYHSFTEKDAAPLIPGEVTEITFDLLPISVLLKKGQRIRLAIAGADSDIFAPIKGCESPELTFERNTQFASYIDLPLVSQETA